MIACLACTRPPGFNPWYIPEQQHHQHLTHPIPSVPSWSRHLSLLSSVIISCPALQSNLCALGLCVNGITQRDPSMSGQLPKTVCRFTYCNSICSRGPSFFLLGNNSPLYEHARTDTPDLFPVWGNYFLKKDPENVQVLTRAFDELSVSNYQWGVCVE